MTRSLLRLAAAALIVCWSAAALAQRPSPRIFDRCDVTFDPVVLSQAYNPMSPNDYVASFTTTAHRPGGDNDSRHELQRRAAQAWQLPASHRIVSCSMTKAGPRETSSMIAPVPRLGEGLGDHGEIEAMI